MKKSALLFAAIAACVLAAGCSAPERNLPPPEMFYSSVERLLEAHKVLSGEGIKRIKLRETNDATVMVTQILREVKPHYRERSDETIIFYYGEGIMTVGGKQFPVQKGSILFIPAGAVRSFLPSDTASHKPVTIFHVFTPPLEEGDMHDPSEKLK